MLLWRESSDPSKDMSTEWVKVRMMEPDRLHVVAVVILFFFFLLLILLLLSLCPTTASTQRISCLSQSWGFSERSCPTFSSLWIGASTSPRPLPTSGTSVSCPFYMLNPFFLYPQVPWLHAVYAVLGAGVFTLVSLAQLLGPPSQPVSSSWNFFAASEGGAGMVPRSGNSLLCQRRTHRAGNRNMRATG